jgi:predicted Zn-dependent protease
VADLLQLLAVYGFNGKAVAERRSFVELDTEQFDPAITIVDDYTEAGGAGIGFDVEGSPTPRLTLVDAGRTAAVAHDRRTAAEAGTTSTGHALPGGASFGAVPTHVHLLPEAGTAPGEVAGPAADSSVAVLVARVGRGLLVTDSWYARVLDPAPRGDRADRNGVWLIEDSEITRPVRNLRFTQS